MPTLADIQAQVNSMPLHQLLTIIDSYSSANKTDFSKLKSELITEDFQDKLKKYGINTSCPYCKGEKIVGFGKRNNVKRFKCKDCGKTFTYFTNTILEKTQYSWDIWVNVLSMILNYDKIEQIHQKLEHNFNLKEIDYKTVFFWYHKLIHAMAQMPMLKLRGIIQVDETFFRESQKGKGKLKSVIKGEERQPRYGRRPSKLGVMGNEFANVVTMVDYRGYTVTKMVGLGKLTLDTFYREFDEYIDNPAYMCSDKNQVYIDYCNIKKIPLYIIPSNYRKIIEQAGYVTPDRQDPALAKEQEKENKRILLHLYRDQKIDYIHDNYMCFNDFCKIKYANSLSIARVNQMHSEFKTRLVTDSHGVSTKYLPDYIGFHTFIRNWKISNGRNPYGIEDAESILIDILKGHITYTTKDMKETLFDFPKSSDMYMSILKKKTARAKEVTGNKYFKFDAEDNVTSFDKRKFLEMLPKYKLEKLRIKYKLPKQWPKYSVISALLKQPDIEDEIYLLIREYKPQDIEDEDVEAIEAEKYRRKRE